MPIIDTDLHLYLDRGPDIATFSDLLSLYGFTYSKTVDSTNGEPVTDYFEWKKPPLSTDGFKLLFFHTLFRDDLNFGNFESYIIISGTQRSSDADIKMIDTTAFLLLDRFGGRLHNPQRIDKIATSFFLSGKPFNGFN